MAPRKRKKKQIDEGPFLFSEEEMLGMITNVNVIESSVPEKGEIKTESCEVLPVGQTAKPEPIAPEAREDFLTISVDSNNKIEIESDKESESVHVSVESVDELSTDERIIVAMTNVLWQMKHMNKSQIRRIAFSITIMCQEGLDLNRSYSVPLIDDEEEISGYDLAAWCYCTFMSAFPSMQDKLQMPYSTHYEEAKSHFLV